MSTRIERCFTDNLYLVESIPPNLNEEKKRVYLIMGSTGNVYSVVITNKPTCTCPDFKQRKKRCKHIYFVLIRIMKVENPIIKYFTNENLEEMFNNIPLITNNLIVDKSKRDKFYEITNNAKSNNNNEINSKKDNKVKQRLNDNDICPICLDNINNGKELDYCKYSCGLTLHKKCFQMWEKRNKGICVFCRADWYNKNKKKSKPNLYVNLLNNERTNNNMINNSLINEIILIENDSNSNNDNDNDNDIHIEDEFYQEIRKRERSRDKDD